MPAGTVCIQVYYVSDQPHIDTEYLTKHTTPTPSLTSLKSLRLRKLLDYLYCTVLHCTVPYFEEMKNLLIHNCIGSHTNCFMSLLGVQKVPKI